MRIAMGIVAAGLVLAGSLVVAAEDSGKTRVFEGEYDWKQGGSNTLSAEFVPKGEDAWKVKFRFRFSGSKHTWKGEARGSLAEGSRLEGTATGGGGRTWDFRADLEDGVLRGTHTETTRGRSYETGTFTLE